MSSTNHTSNYNLSQFIAGDKPAWLVDYNSDMSKIDAQMKTNADAIETKLETVDTNDIENGAVTTNKIADDAITTNKILNSNVSNSKIANLAVDATKLADGAVATAKIEDGAVTASKIDWTSRGKLYLNKTYVSAPSPITNTTGLEIATGTITTNGGDLFIEMCIEGTLGNSGLIYGTVKIDDTEYNIVSTNNHTQTQNNVSGSRIITGLSAGTHDIIFKVRTDSNTGVTYQLAPYSYQSVSIIEV